MTIRSMLERASALVLFGALAACGAPTPPSAAPATVPGPEVAAEAGEAPPPPLPMEPLEFPPFQETVLANGLRLIVVEEHGQPVANIDLYVESGAAADPVEKAGLVGMTADLLTKGTETRSAEEISEAIEGVGGNLNAFAGNDYINISSTVLSGDLPLAFDLVSDVTLHPTFPEDELEIARTRELSSLQAQLGQPGVIARRRFATEVYGPDHPYAFAPTPATVEAIERADLVSFHENHFSADNALLVISGDVDAGQVMAAAREHFEAWEGGGVPEAAFVTPPAREQSVIYLVHRPGSVQSNILVGHVGIRPDNPDYYPLQVLNKIVGGGTDARLFQILREEKGWTYGAYSRFTRPEEVGYFVASAEVRTEVTDSALVEMMTQLRRIREEPVSEEELKAAQSFLAGSFPLRIQTPGQIASQVAETRLLGLPIESLTEYRERIAEVTIQDVQRVAREYIRPERAVITVVGDGTQVLEDIEGIAPIQLYNVEGEPLERSDLVVRASTTAWDGSRLEPGTRTYQVTVQGNAMGTATSTLTREGDAWVATSEIENPMATQQSELRFGAASLEPISVSQTAMQQGTELNTELQFADGRVTGTAQLPPQAGREQTVDAEVVQGTLLPGMDEYVLAVADLPEGETLTLPVFNPLSGSATSVTYTVTGTETVTVPAGEFSTYRVEVSGGPQPMVLYLQQELPHLVVKQELVGLPVTIELQSVQ